MKILTYAAIDIGSNAVRLLINHIYESKNQKQPAVFNKTALIRVPIRLGQDAFQNQHISDINIERLNKSMESFKLLMEVYKVEKYKAFATSAMRDSDNGADIIKLIKERTGIEIEIIDGDQEAEIIFQTELSTYKDNQYYLFVDVGGGQHRGFINH